LKKVLIKKAEDKQISEVIRSGIKTLLSEDELKGYKSVFVKPNLVSDVPGYIKKGSNTDIRIIEAVLTFFSNYPEIKVYLGESETGTKVKGRRLDNALGFMGVSKLKEKYDFEIVNLTYDEKVEVPIEGGRLVKSLQLGRTFVESDLIINLPKMKTHKYSTITCAMKNMIGAIPDPLRVIYHKNVHKIIADINSIFFKKMLVIVDGLIGMEGQGPLSGDPVPMDLILFARNPYDADLAASKIMGFDLDEIEHLRLFKQQYCNYDLKGIEVIGEPFKENLYNFKRFRTNLFIKIEERCKQHPLVVKIMFNTWIQKNILYHFRKVFKKWRGDAYSCYLDKK